jgi:hypothetical protein
MPDKAKKSDLQQDQIFLLLKQLISKRMPEQVILQQS